MAENWTHKQAHGENCAYTISRLRQQFKTSCIDHKLKPTDQICHASSEHFAINCRLAGVSFFFLKKTLFCGKVIWLTPPKQDNRRNGPYKENQPID